MAAGLEVFGTEASPRPVGAHLLHPVRHEMPFPTWSWFALAGSRRELARASTDKTLFRHERVLNIVRDMISSAM